MITAVNGGLFISVLGGSRVQIGGPTGAFIVIVYAVVQDHGIGGLTIATFMAGLIIIGLEDSDGFRTVPQMKSIDPSHADNGKHVNGIRSKLKGMTLTPTVWSLIRIRNQMARSFFVKRNF